MNILVTGGAGYIGSHTVLCLLESGFEVVVLDNLCNSKAEAVKRVEQISRKHITFIRGDIRVTLILDKVFSEHQIGGVIHFAALKAVGESAEIPLSYYDNNVHGSICLLKSMIKHGVNNFIFSSSATVYGEQNLAPYTEKMQFGKATSPYGSTKIMVELIIKDIMATHKNFKGVSLRYFNPIGAHESGLIGEDPNGKPNNLLPFIAQVAAGKREELEVFGDNYPTHDGTCERDYVHVMDLAEGHVAALGWLNKQSKLSNVESFNLGTGAGTSVLSIIKAFESATGITVPFKITSARIGDLAAFWADASKAKHFLGWQAKRTLLQMMTDTWRWQSSNLNGYR